MRNDRDHVFIDCAPARWPGRPRTQRLPVVRGDARRRAPDHRLRRVSLYGLRRRTQQLPVDGVHNTPQIDGAELNRFVSPFTSGRCTTMPRPRCGGGRTRRSATCSSARGGYARLTPAATRPQDRPGTRAPRADHQRSHRRLGDAVSIPLHLAPGVDVERSRRAAFCSRPRGRNSAGVVVRWRGRRDRTGVCRRATRPRRSSGSSGMLGGCRVAVDVPCARQRLDA